MASDSSHKEIFDKIQLNQLKGQIFVTTKTVNYCTKFIVQRLSYCTKILKLYFDNSFGGIPLHSSQQVQMYQKGLFKNSFQVLNYLMEILTCK